MERLETDKLDNLLARAREHDEGAMTELLRIHNQRLLDSVRAELGQRLRQRLESQDVMQQVYLDALRNIDQFVDMGHDSFFRWLRRIAVNRICDVDRKEFQALKRKGEVRAADLGRDASMIRLLVVPSTLASECTLSFSGAGASFASAGASATC